MKIDLYIFFGSIITGVSIYMEWYNISKNPMIVISFGLLALTGLMFIIYGLENLGGKQK